MFENIKSAVTPKSPKPRFALFEITDYCHNNCPECYRKDKNTNKHVATEQVCQTVSSLSEGKLLSKRNPSKRKHINLFGGEPLAHPNFNEIVFDTPENTELTILTSGSFPLYNADTVDQVLKAKLPDVTFSISLHKNLIEQFNLFLRKVINYRNRFRVVLHHDKVLPFDLLNEALENAIPGYLVSENGKSMQEKQNNISEKIKIDRNIAKCDNTYGFSFVLDEQKIIASINPIDPRNNAKENCYFQGSRCSLDFSNMIHITTDGRITPCLSTIFHQAAFLEKNLYEYQAKYSDWERQIRIDLRKLRNRIIKLTVKMRKQMKEVYPLQDSCHICVDGCGRYI